MIKKIPMAVKVKMIKKATVNEVMMITEAVDNGNYIIIMRMGAIALISKSVKNDDKDELCHNTS